MVVTVANTELSDLIYKIEIIAKNENLTIGSILAYRYLDDLETGYLTCFQVIEKYRKQGIGKQLFDYTISKLKEIGCKTIILKVKENSWQRSWYERMGFNFYSNDDNEPNMVWLKQQKQ